MSNYTFVRKSAFYDQFFLEKRRASYTFWQKIK